MPLALPNRFVNGEIADAVPVDDNDQRIQNYINSSVVTADGLVAMTAPLTLAAGDPSAANHAANKDYVDAQMPIGTILMWSGPTAPAGPKWHLCDGGSLSRTNYVALFAVLDYRYGGSGGSFLLPNLKARFPVGFDSTQTAFNTIGESGGTFTVPVPPHAHAIDHDHSSFNSSDNQSDHTHSIAHNHGSFNSSYALQAHQHSLALRNNATAGSSADSVMAANSATGTVQVGANTGNDATGAFHQHQVDVPNYVGNSGVNSGDHTHSINVPPFTGNSVNNTAALTPTGIATTQIQPYLTINFIIRII